MRRTQIVGMAIGLVFCALPLFAQEQPAIREKIDVNLVLVDVTVTDNDGNQILGLDKNDFIIREDGKPQEIASIDYFTNRRLLSGTESQAAFKVERVKQDRYFILFFHQIVDAGGMPELRQQLLRAKEAAEKFVDDDMLPGDHVAVAGYTARLVIFSDFTSDKATLKEALNDAVGFGRGVREASGVDTPSILANIDTRQMMRQTGRIESAIDLLAKAVEPIQARKVLVLFSPGVVEPGVEFPTALAFDRAKLDSLVQTLNESNVSVYSINLLQDTLWARSEDFLSAVANETGGEYFRAAVTYSLPLQRVENENNGYYLLSYYTDKRENEHGYQEIEVSLKNPQFRLKAREGYKY